MILCQHCQCELVTDGIRPGQQIRCAHCEELSTLGRSERVTTDRLAWRSFWLGISSIVLLFFTGLPAIYYGIRSLLRMRFVRPKRIDRAAAVVGIGMGGFFGVFVGFLVAIIGSAFLYARLTSYSTDSATEIVERCHQHFAYQFPAGIVPIEANTVAGKEHAFRFADSIKAEQRHLELILVHLEPTFQVSERTFVRDLSRKSIENREGGKMLGTESFDWEMNGQPIKANKSTYGRQLQHTVPDQRDSSSDFQPTPVEGIGENKIGSESADSVLLTNRYIGYFETDQGYYGIAVVIEVGQHPLSETEVKQIFSKVRAVPQVTTTLDHAD